MHWPTDRSHKPRTPAPSRVAATVLAVAILGALLWVGTACHPRRSDPSSELTVATWNIRWFPSGQPEPQPPEVEALAVEAAGRHIRRAEPHILCVQEIRDRSAAEALARATGLQGLAVAACSDFPLPDGMPGHQQTAILTNLPVLESASERWHAVGMVDPPRGYAYALLQAPFGPVAVFSVHLKSNFIPEDQDPEAQTPLNRAKRELAAKQLRDVAARRLRQGGPGVRLVIAGDFNTSLYDARWEGEGTLRDFRTAGYACVFDGIPSARVQTVPGNAFHPPVAFDYILFRGFTVGKAARIHPRQWVSDHCLVSARLAP